MLFSCSVMSDCLQHYGLQHTGISCPSLSSRVCSSSCPLSQWYHPTISSSVALFSSCLQSFPASGSFPISQLHIRWPKYWSFSFSISPSNEYSRLTSFRIDWFYFLAVQGTLKSSPAPQFESINSLVLSSHIRTWLALWPNSHVYIWLLEIPGLWLYGPLSTKWCLWSLIRCLGLSFQETSIMTINWNLQ